MYIEPNTTIKIYHNVPLDNSYDDTINFASISAQNAYFHSGLEPLKYTLSRQSFQRVTRGVMRIAIKSDDLYDCNYISFQNTNFGNKWFYAFITGVDYVNNETSEVSFEIDVMQTYMFDSEVKACFVEREHTTSDNFGEHILDEGLDTGEYIMSDYNEVTDGGSTFLRDNVIVVSYSEKDATQAHGVLVDGVFSGTRRKVFNANYSGCTALSTFLDTYMDTPDNIVSIYMAPKFCFPYATDGGIDVPTGTSGSARRGVTVNPLYIGTSDFQGYIPRNNKLYCYPYNFVHVDNANGENLSLRYEFFNDFLPRLNILGNASEPVQIVCRPSAYKGTKSGTELSPWESLNSESITLQSYPQCSWRNDSFASWVAQNSVPIAINTFAQGVVSGYSGNPLPLLNQGVSVLTQGYKASIATDVVKGNVQTGNVNFANSMQTFYSGRCHITADYARAIDDFFTRYGYACRRVKVPNRNARTNWTYTKTEHCKVIGGAPADDLKKIEQIYDHGITFWNNPSAVGNYNLPNNPY